MENAADTQPQHIVVVGGGLTAAKAVETLRDEGFDGSITVVGAEHHLPYERPPLSKDVLLSDATPEDSVTHHGGWYDEHRVHLRRGTRATAIDTEARRVSLHSGEALDYDALLIATGAEPAVPDIEGADVALYLRTMEDAHAVDDALTVAAAQDGGRIVVIGGGWIGLEVAAAARTRGVEVTLLERGELPLLGILGREVAAHLAEVHLSHGADLRTSTEVRRIIVEDGRPAGVETADGRIDAAAVLVGTGATPSVELAEAAGLTVDDGIVVDDHFRTSAEGVWAAGDVARADHPTWGPLRVEHWDNAIKQGQAAARSILGQDVRHNWHPYFFTDQHEFSMEYVGHGSGDDDVEIRGDLAGNAFIAYWLDDDDRVTAAMNVGIWDVNDTLREMVGTVVRREDLTDLS